ncbi:MAG: DUF4920 domain-containing protein [Bacteroidetes bacterium]|nr:DUF4920 domain-containing protein [Bacteroidota bacterium]
MKKWIFTFVLGAGMMASCNQTDYGKPVDISKAISVDEGLKAFRDKGTSAAVIKGQIGDVCQSEGCWYNFKTSSGDQFVDFNHKFTIPKDSKGKTAVAAGKFFYDTVSVEQLKEYAKDDGKTDEEISKITEPKIEIHFLAEGLKFTK